MKIATGFAPAITPLITYFVMKRLIFVLALCAAGMKVSAGERDSLLTVFWNLENFFDYHDDGNGESDREFSPEGKRRWTSRRFYEKCHLVAKSLFWIGDRYGRMPDVIGVAEVENRSVLNRLLKSTSLRKYDYQVVHRESRDRRGIDVALIYRRSCLDLVDISYHVPEYDGERMNTRDILHSRFRRKSDGGIYDFIVNHHPSKFGGPKESDGRRQAAMRTLRTVCDSLSGVSSVEGYTGVVAMGDFNDNPSGEQFGLLDGVLLNACEDEFRRGEGTIRFEGKWDLIDMFWVTPDLLEVSRSEILRIPFLMTRDRKHPGEKPLRTYSGPRYLGGVSDHCPIVLRIL